MPADDLILVLSNAPDLLLAKRIAHVLIENKLAACVNLSAVGLSMYEWNGVMEGAEEISLTIKTTLARCDEVVQLLHRMHPYEVPEILVLPVQAVATPYADWVRHQTLDSLPPSP